MTTSLMTYLQYVPTLHRKSKWKLISQISVLVAEPSMQKRKTQQLIISWSNQICQWTSCLINFPKAGFKVSDAVYLTASCARTNPGSVGVENMISLCKSHVNLVLLHCDYHPVVSYPFFYISALWGLPANKRLYPVDVWFPVAPDLPSCFVCKESCDTEGDDNQESTRHGNSLEKQKHENKIWKVVKDISCKIACLSWYKKYTNTRVMS